MAHRKPIPVNQHINGDEAKQASRTLFYSRLQHYGEGDKIPRHRYGIYSKQWPMEREKAIRDARQGIQTTFTRSQIGTFMQVNGQVFYTPGGRTGPIKAVIKMNKFFKCTRKNASQRARPY